MDFNDFLSDLRTAGQEFSEKISDKYAATMAYCETACKALDRLERDAGPYENQVIGLWVFLGYIQETYPRLAPGPAINALCQKIFRHCARTVLNIQWQQLDENSTSRQNFKVTLQNLNQCLSANGYTRFSLILSLMDSGWTRPVLSQVMGGEEDTEDGEGLNYIINEDPVILKIRVEMMLQENCEEFALNLCSWCLKHPALKDDLDIRQTQLMLFHKLNNADRLQEECQKIPCHDGVRLISRMRQMEKYKTLCTRLAQIFLVQDWIRQSEHCCTKDLLKLWIRHQYLADRDKEKFLKSVWAIAKLSSATDQILLMIDALKLECGDMFLQLYTDLCIFALNFDKSCLEKHMQDGDMEGLRNRQQAMASTCEKLATVYLKNDTKIARYSAVTSFALNPSTETLSFVEKFYVNCNVPYVIDRGKQTHDDEKCCTNCFRGEGTCRYKKSEGNVSDVNVDVATLLEVERLLNMLRPFYLNPDMKWTELRPLCQRFLHERERLAQKFALEIAETCAADADNKDAVEQELSSPDTPPAPSTAPPASALTQASTTTNLQQQAAHTPLVKNENPAYLPQNIHTATTKGVPQQTSKSVSGQQQTFPKHVSRPVSSSQQTGAHVIKVVTSQHNDPHVTRPSSMQQNIPRVMRPTSTEQTVPHVSRPASMQPVVSHVSRPVTVQQTVQHVSRPVSVQPTVQYIARPVSSQQTVPQYITRPASHQNIPPYITRPVSMHQTVTQHVNRPACPQYVSQHAVTRETYSSPVNVSSQQNQGTVQQDTSSLVGIEPSVMIRNLLFTNEDISLTDADALVELLQQALPGGGTELPETLQDITMDNTGVSPAVHVQESVPEQTKRAHTDSNFMPIYSTPITAQTVQTSLCNTSHVNVTGGNVNTTSHNLTHASSVPSFSLPVGSQTVQSNSVVDVAALLNLQTVLEMPQLGIPSSGHSQKPVSQSLSYVTIVTQAEMVTSSAPSQNSSRINIPIQPKLTHSRVLRPGVAGVVQQGIGAGQQPVQAMMTTNLHVSNPSQGPVRMTAVGSQIKQNAIDTSVQSLHLSSLPGKPVVTPKCYPNVSSSTEHSNITVAQKTEQIQYQQQSVSSLIENSLKNIGYQQSNSASKAGNSELYAQQIVSSTSQKSGHMSLDPEHAGSVQRTVLSLTDHKQGESVSVSQGLMQNIFTGGSVQVLPSPSSMMLNAAGIANILQSSANVASKSPTILYTTAPPSSMSAVPHLDINQQTQPGTADISNVIALLNLQSQLISQANPQSETKADTTKTLKQAFNDLQKNKKKNRNPAVETFLKKDQVNVKVVPSSSQEKNVNQLKVGISADVAQEPLLSMQLHGIPVQFAPPPSASVLEQTVTCANDPVHLQNTTATAALFQHLQSTQPALVQQGQQVQQLVGSLSQQLQQSSVTVMPSTGQTQNNLVQQGQTIFIPAAGQQTPALFQPATVGQMTLVHQIPCQTLFGQPSMLETGNQISNVSQLSVADESSIKQTNKNVTKSKTVKSSEVPFSASNQVSTGGVTQPTTSSVSKAHVPFMLASRLCSSSSKKYNLSSSQSKSSQKTKVNLKDLPATSKAVDYPSYPISSKASEVTSQLERFLLNSVLPKHSTDSGQQQIVQEHFHHGIQSADSLHTQLTLPSHSDTLISQTNTQSLPQINFSKKSDNLQFLDTLGVKSSSDGTQVLAGYNGEATDRLNNAVYDLTGKTVMESVLDKYSGQVDCTLFSQTENLSKNTLQNTDLETDQPYLIENVSSKDLVASKVYEHSDDFSKLTCTVPSSNSGVSIAAHESKSDVQKKRIVSKRLFATKFKCMICSNIFENMDELRIHVQNPCSPGIETSLEKHNRINACEEALKKSPYSSKNSSDKAPQVTKKSLEASRVYECPVCKVLCKTDEEVLHHRFDCLKSKSKPRTKKPKVPAANTYTITSDPTTVSASSVMTDLSSAGLSQHDTSFSSGAMSLTVLSPLSLNSGGMVSPLTTALVSPVTMTATLESPMSTSVASSLSSTSPGIPVSSGDVSSVKPVKFVSHKKGKRVPHTGLLGTRPKPPPKPMTPERIADLLLVWRTVEWVRAALGVAAPSFRIKALDLARSNATTNKESDSQLIEALDIDKSVVPKMKLYQEKQKKMKSKKKKKSSPKADSSLESIASVKSLTKSQPKEKAPPKKKKETQHSVDSDGNVKKSETKKIEKLSNSEIKKTEKSPNSQQFKPVKKKKTEEKPKPKFKVLEHLGRKYYKCDLCGQTFCNLDFMVSEHWEKCLSQNPKQRKSKPGGPGDKKLQKTKANKDTDSSEDKTVSQSKDDVNQPMSIEKSLDAVLQTQNTESKLENTSVVESVEQGVEKESIQQTLRSDKINPVSSVVKVDAPHIDFAALMKETFSNALDKRTTDTVNLLDDESIVEMLSNDMMPNQSYEMKNDSTVESTNLLQKSEKILERIQECADMAMEDEKQAIQSENVPENTLLPNLNDNFTKKTEISSSINNPCLESKFAHIESSVVYKPQVQKSQNDCLNSSNNDNTTVVSGSRTDTFIDFQEYLTPQPVEEKMSSLSSNKSVPNVHSVSKDDSLSEESKLEINTTSNVNLASGEVLKQLPSSSPENNFKYIVDNSLGKSSHWDVGSSSQTNQFTTQIDGSEHNSSSKEKEENLQTDLSDAEVEEKSIIPQTHDKDHVHCVDKTNDVDQTVDRPSLVFKSSSSPLEERYSGETIVEKTCDSDSPDQEESSNDKALYKSTLTVTEKNNSIHLDQSYDSHAVDKNSQTTKEHIHKDELKQSGDSQAADENGEFTERQLDENEINQSCDSQTVDENKVTKEQINENPGEEEVDKSHKSNVIDSADYLGKKRPVLDRDAKNINNGSSFMLKQADESTGNDVSCDACGALFRHVRTLIQHMVSRHLHPKQWTATATSTAVCPFCDLNCNSYMTYMDHLPKHTTVILEKMRHYLLSDEKKSHNKTQNRVPDLLNCEPDEENVDTKKEQNHSKQDSLDAFDTDVEVKVAKKRGRPRKPIKTESVTEVQNVTNTEDCSVQSADSSSIKQETSDESTKDLVQTEDLFPVRKTRSKTSRELRQRTESKDCVLLTRSRKRSLSPLSTRGHGPSKTAKWSDTKTKSLRKEISHKRGSPNYVGTGQRKSIKQQPQTDLIKATQAHVVLKKMVVFDSHNSSEKKQTSDKKTEKRSENIKQEDIFSRKSYSLRNAAHMYIKSKQSKNDLRNSTQNDKKKNPEFNKRKTSCKKDEKMHSVENYDTEDGDVEKQISESMLSTPPCTKKLKLQFLKRYDETSICFSKKDKCWQAYDRVAKMYKLLSPKHFVGVSRCAAVKEKKDVTENLENSESKEQLIANNSEEEQKCEQTENTLDESLEEKSNADENCEKPLGLCSPSFQESYMSYIGQFSSESGAEDAEISEAQNSNSPMLTAPQKDVKTLQNIVKSDSFSWDDGEDSGKTPNEENNVCETKSDNLFETKSSELKLMNSKPKGDNQVHSSSVKEIKPSEQSANEDLITSLTGKSDEEKDTFKNTVNMVLEVTTKCKNTQEIKDVESDINQMENNSADIDKSKNVTTMRQPKSLKVMAAKIQVSKSDLKPEVAVAKEIKSVVAKTEAESVRMEVTSKTESDISGKEKQSNSTKPQQSDTEEDEDDTKRQRIERSLKSLREKSNVAPFTWDVDEDERPVSRVSRASISTHQTNKPRETVYSRAISVGTSPPSSTSPLEMGRTRFKHSGEGMLSEGIRKVTRSCSSESVFNVVSHTQSTSSNVSAKTDFRTIGGREIKRPISIGTEQSYRTRSCDQRSSELNNFLQRKVKLESRPEDNTVCRKRRISRSEESQERKRFGMAVTSKEPVRAKYGSSRGQQTFSSVAPLPAVVRRNSHRLTSPVYTKPSVSSYQFYRVAPNEEPKGDSLRNSRSIKPAYEERTRHTLVVGEHVQSGPQLRNSGGKKLDQKWVIDKRKHKKSSFPYAFTRIGNQRK